MNDSSVSAGASGASDYPSKINPNAVSALQALFDNLPAAIYLVNSDYQLIAVSKTRSSAVNLPSSAFLNRPCYQVLYNRSSPCPLCRLSETLLEGLSTQRFERRKTIYGDLMDWEIKTIPVFDDAGNITRIMVVEQDITEKRSLENILSQSEKLAIIGQLAAGMAHELNNPLTAILANAQIIQSGLETGNELQESVELIIKASERAVQVVQNLLDFARKEDFHLVPTDIPITIQRSLELIHHELVGHKVSLEYLPDYNMPKVLASDEHLQSVWLNLLMNAIDSMDKEPAKIRISTKKMDETVQIIIGDNGRGIAPDHQKRIFEPFYTTKRSGKGTGLGLSISQRIVKQHGGEILVESQPGVGSQFIVTLPVLSTGFSYE